jgi:hypothetical protein
LILFVVLALHAALFAALLMISRCGSAVAPAESSVELIVLPPPENPRKVRAEFVSARRFTAHSAVAMTPPVLDSPMPATSLPPASSSNGSGSGVDWAAEARRALQAFEIRTHEPPRNDAISSEPKEDNWWPRARHHAGEEFKTPNGDWIVWIDANCYRVAGSRPSTSASDTTLPHAICIGEAPAAAN